MIALSRMTRDWVVEEARSWIGTPYHKGARVKGAGIDCGTFLLEVFLRAGFLSEEDARKLEEIIPVAQDWFCHTNEERYLKAVIRHARHVLTAISRTTLTPLPGCIAVTHHDHTSRTWNHGGIITRWPMVVHAVGPFVKQVDATTDGMWECRQISIYDPWLGPEPENA